MKKLFVSLAAICFAISSHAQLSGVITDEVTGEKIPGAVITVENTFLKTVSDSSGNFSFDNLKEGKVKITITHLSYEKYSEEISLPRSTKNFPLKTKIFLADEVNISATRADDKSPTAFTNVTKEDLGKQNLGQDLPYLLNITPSVVVTSDAGTGIGYTGIRIRGSDATRINFTINGIPVNDAEENAVYLVDLPDFASSVDNIQIQRGVGTSTNGAGAFGGSMNMQTSKLSLNPFATINSSAGSFNTFKNTVQFGTGLMKNKFAFEGRLSKINSDGYIDRATSDLKSFYLSGGYYGNKSSLRAIIFSGKEKTYQAWYGVPQDSLTTNRTYNPAGEYYDDFGNIHYYDNQTDNYQQDYYQLIYSKEINNLWNVNIGLHYTMGNGYYEEYVQGQNFVDYGLEEVMVNGQWVARATDLIRQRWLDNDFYGFTFSANYQKKNFQLTIGGAGNQYKGEHFGEIIWAQFASNSYNGYRYYDDDATKNDFNIFAKANYNIIPKINLYYDVQLRAIDYSFAPALAYSYSTTGQQNARMNFFNPKVGASYDFNAKNKVYASFGVGHKEPTRSDFTDSSPRSRPIPEEMRDVEAGYKYISNKFSLTANLYYMNYTDQLVLTGKINDVGLYTKQNVEQSFRRGIELEAGYKISKKFALSGNITLSENKIKNFEEYTGYGYGDPIVYDVTDIAFSPSVISAAIISYLPAEKLQVDFVTKYVGKQFLDNTSHDEASLKAYLVNNVRINYSIKTKIFKELTIQLLVNNLFDNLYESNGYSYSFLDSNMERQSYSYYYPQAGRNYFGGIVIKF